MRGNNTIITICLIALALILWPQAVRAQCPAGDWRVPTTQPPLSDWSQIAFGNGRFVAVSSGSGGADAYVAHSTDGMVWTQSATSIPDNEWRWITYGNGLFVAVGWHGSRRIMTSPDGNTWTMVNSTLTNNGSWQSVAYGKGRFVAVANNGTRIITSENGTTWTARTAPAGDYSTVAYGGGRFVVLSFSGSGTTALYSSDGIAWNTTTMPNGSWLDVVYGGGQFVAVSWTGNHIATSPDGIVWTARSVPDSRSWGAVTYTGGHYVVVGGGGSGPNRMMVSSDGITWEPKPIPHDGQSLSTATWGNNILLVTGHDLYPGQSQFFVGDCPERCYMPDGKRGAREWFASANLYKFCDGERWRDFANDGTAGGCSVPGQMEWNEPQTVHTVCDGANRQILRHAGDLGVCAKKAAIDFEPGIPLYKYCDGSRWRPMIPDLCGMTSFQAVTNVPATATELSRSGTLQNTADGPRFTLSLWFKMKPYASNPQTQVLFENTSGRIQLGFYSDHPGDPIYDIWVQGKNSSDTYRAEVQAYDIIFEDVWYHAIASWTPRFTPISCVDGAI